MDVHADLAYVRLILLKGLSAISIGLQHVVCVFLSSDWLLTESLSGIQSSSLTETGMIIAFTSAVLH